MLQILKPQLCDTNQLAEEIGINHTAITFDGYFLNIDISDKEEKKVYDIVKNHVPAWSLN